MAQGESLKAMGVTSYDPAVCEGNRVAMECRVYNEDPAKCV